jgi:hypothetical protein
MHLYYERSMAVNCNLCCMGAVRYVRLAVQHFPTSSEATSLREAINCIPFLGHGESAMNTAEQKARIENEIEPHTSHLGYLWARQRAFEGVFTASEAPVGLKYGHTQK